MTDKTYDVPSNDEQEVALEKALAGARKKKLEGVKAFLETPHAKKFQADLAELAKVRLPDNTAAKMNVANLVSFLDTMQRSIIDEIGHADRLVNASVEELLNREVAPPVPEV